MLYEVLSEECHRWEFPVLHVNVNLVKRLMNKASPGCQIARSPKDTTAQEDK